MREYLDPFVKADQCAQNVDDIGIAANNARQSSSAFAKQVWNWQLKNAILESDKLNS